MWRSTRPRANGQTFQNSYEAFHRRRLIRRFLAGDMKDGMDDKGKTMFPMNCECYMEMLHALTDLVRRKTFDHWRHLRLPYLPFGPLHPKS